ncbi:MAG: UDP-N-acetylmuramoylalanyl-D-glutamyl-2, 6-diaminopimelate--D-alanyl-D-alanine ligase, partial [Betaproteobacteria bacterium]|nr:UDP-N-acetylmuramoylalanyl-D-glutamyl-2, 6-diaminopimelate--D-alanyl-D-alanine ligase [Betaproteobacteria bacterium]
DLLADLAGARQIFGFAKQQAPGCSASLVAGDEFAFELADGTRIGAPLQVHGEHNRINALCAAVSCLALGVERAAIEAGL